MHRRYIPLCILLIYGFCYTAESCAQGMYFRAEESGFAFGGGCAGGDRPGRWALQGGYSYHGMYDIGAIVSKPVEPHRIDVMSIAPFFSVHIFKESNHSPLSFQLTMGYQYEFYMGEAMRFREEAVHGSAATVTGRLYKALSYNGPHYLIPYLGVGLVMRQDEAPSGSINNQDTMYEFGLDAVFCLTSRIGIVPGVNITLYDEEYSFGASVNLIDRSL